MCSTEQIPRPGTRSIRIAKRVVPSIHLKVPAEEIDMFMGGGILGTILVIVIIIFLVKRM